MARKMPTGVAPVSAEHPGGLFGFPRRIAPRPGVAHRCAHRPPRPGWFARRPSCSSWIDSPALCLHGRTLNAAHTHPRVSACPPLNPHADATHHAPRGAHISMHGSLSDGFPVLLRAFGGAVWLSLPRVGWAYPNDITGRALIRFARQNTSRSAGLAASGCAGAHSFLATPR